MKEYICKEDLIKTISEYEIYGNKEFLEDLFGAISSITTVTKADICESLWDKISTVCIFNADDETICEYADGECACKKCPVFSDNEIS